MRISLEQFIEETKGQYVDVSFPHKSNLKGNCVSLIQEYLRRCLGQPDKARGHAKDWINTYVNEGLGKRVNDLRKGDILVFPNRGIIENVTYGHIAICVDGRTLYDQANKRHDGGKAGLGEIFGNDYVILRPNVELVEDVKPEPVVEQPVQPEPVVNPLHEGVRVRTIAAGNGSSNGEGISAASGLEGVISRVIEGRPYPYCVDDAEGPLGWYKAEALQII